MKLRSLLCVVALLAPSSAMAGPITSGVWSSVTEANNDSSPFWDNQSIDCANCNVGELLGIQLGGYSGLEYLNDGVGSFVSFLFDDPAIAVTKIDGITAWKNGTLGRNSIGAFTYNSGTGRLSNSWDKPGQYALFRQVGATTTQYFMGVEDILLTEVLNDRDYNDYVVTFTLPDAPPPTPVPEPSSILLLGVGIAGLAASKRYRRAARPAGTR